MPIDLSKVNLDAPAFGDSAQKVEDHKEDDTAEVSQTKSVEEKKEPATSSADDDVPEQRVPYSRFETANKRARQAERDAEEARDELARLRNRPERDDQSRSSTGDLPSWWVKMYGDNEVSKEAFGYYQQGQTEIREEARREAVEAVRQERESESKAITGNEKIIDERLEDLSAYLGRDLTEKEQDTLLEIVDEYTPKGEDGRFLGDLISFDKAWEIYELRQGQTTQKTKRSRSAVTSATSARSQGEPDGDKKASDEKWNPLDWNSWTKKIPK